MGGGAWEWGGGGVGSRGMGGEDELGKVVGTGEQVSRLCVWGGEAGGSGGMGEGGC